MQPEHLDCTEGETTRGCAHWKDSQDKEDSRLMMSCNIGQTTFSLADLQLQDKDSTLMTDSRVETLPEEASE